jgi:hypothetical protein
LQRVAAIATIVSIAGRKLEQTKRNRRRRLERTQHGKGFQSKLKPFFDTWTKKGISKSKKLTAPVCRCLLQASTCSVVGNYIGDPPDSVFQVIFVSRRLAICGNVSVAYAVPILSSLFHPDLV